MTLSVLRHKFHQINIKPSEAQKHAGNYKKGHVRIHGLDVTIENPKGSIRHGIDKNGKKWSSVLPDHYGYIKRTKGNDGDHVDCYIGPNTAARNVFVVDQKHHDTGEFDEHKCMIGYDAIGDAVTAYRGAFTDGNDRVLAVTIMTINRFKKWLRDGNTKNPIRYFSNDKKS